MSAVVSAAPRAPRPAPWLDLDLADRTGEEWRDIAGYDGYYQVSSHGRVKSLDRLDRQGRRVRSKIRKQAIQQDAAMAVVFCVDGIQQNCQVLRLVGLAFFPPLPPGQVWYHQNKLATLDNTTGNILVGEPGESFEQSRRFGLMAELANRGQQRQAEKKVYEQQVGLFAGGVLVAKACSQCLVTQPIDQFHCGARLNHRRICRECSDRRQGGVAIGKMKQAARLAAQGLRSCSYCQQVKPLDAFHRSRSSYLGRGNGCKPCINERRRAERAAGKAAGKAGRTGRKISAK